MKENIVSILICLITLLCVISFAQTLPDKDEISMAEEFFNKFVQSSSAPGKPPALGSLDIGDLHSSEITEGWERKVTVEKTDIGTNFNIHLLHQPTQLCLIYRGLLYKDFPVIEWTAYYRNESKSNSPILENLKSIDITFSDWFGEKVTLYRNRGDNCEPESYQPIVEELKDGLEISVANTGGRPTQISFPYFNINGDKSSVIYVLSWAGQWATKIARKGDAVAIQGGQEKTHLFLYPGEEIRGPMVVLLFYKGNKTRGQNIWRQWMIAHNIPKPDGNPPKVPLLLGCSSHQYGEMINANTENQLMFIQKYLDRGIKLDYWWMDAGWYPCDGNWFKTGTWVVDETRFPGGFKPISDFAHSKAIKILVWFEPERVHKDTWISENHPEWVIGGKDGGLLKIGEKEVREWLTNHIDNLLKTQGIDLYRQDFNMDPLDHWRKNDPPDRQGITEIRHVEGYLAYWDELLHRNPGMLIDSCSGGGRRNVLETLRRAVPLLRSDYIMEPVGNQCHTWSLAEWFPFFGTGTSKTSDYEVLSVLSPSFTACWDQRQENIEWARLKKIIDDRHLYADCYYGDYFQLTPWSLANDVWIAWQFHLGSKGKGFIQAFRRELAEDSSYILRLNAISSEKTYKFIPLKEGMSPTTITGKELLDKGYSVTIPDRPGAVIVLYQEI
ncbi:MAG: alpha-galactosidase [Candidatus Hydrogenedentes bacterium]|nr:alpha-galactosidase [Candidatus Hydrogenedentota bacterium]